MMHCVAQNCYLLVGCYTLSTGFTRGFHWPGLAVEAAPLWHCSDAPRLHGAVGSISRWPALDGQPCGRHSTMRTLLLCLASTATAYPSTRGADLYAVINASRDASPAALLEAYADAVEASLAPAAHDAAALARQASEAADAHDAALTSAREAGAHARAARAAVENALLEAKRAIRHAASALRQAVQGEELEMTLARHGRGQRLADYGVDRSTEKATDVVLKRHGDVQRTARQVEANATNALLFSSLSEESAALVRRVWTSFLKPPKSGMTPKQLALRVPTTEELLDACDPLLSSYAEKTWPKWSWWVPAENNDPRFEVRRAWQKTLGAAFNYMTGPVKLSQFQHSTLRTVAHLPIAEVTAFVEQHFVMNETSGNVSTMSGRFILDAINATRALNDPGLAGVETPTPDALRGRPPRFIERRGLLLDVPRTANASLARAIETSCLRLDAVPDALRQAQRLAEAAGDAAAAAARALSAADALRREADAALAAALTAAKAHADRERLLDAAFRVFSDADARSAYNAPCVPSRDAPGCCERAAPGGAGIVLTCSVDT